MAFFLKTFALYLLGSFVAAFLQTCFAEETLKARETSEHFWKTFGIVLRTSRKLFTFVFGCGAFQLAVGTNRRSGAARGVLDRSRPSTKERTLQAKPNQGNPPSQSLAEDDSKRGRQL